MFREREPQVFLHQMNVHDILPSGSTYLLLDEPAGGLCRYLHEAENGKAIKLYLVAHSPVFNQALYNSNDVYCYGKKNGIANKAVAFIKKNMIVQYKPPHLIGQPINPCLWFSSTNINELKEVITGGCRERAELTNAVMNLPIKSLMGQLRKRIPIAQDIQQKKN